MAVKFMPVSKSRNLRYLVLFAILFTIHGKKIECSWSVFKSGGGSSGGPAPYVDPFFSGGDNYFEIPANDPDWEYYCYQWDQLLYYWCEIQWINDGYQFPHYGRMRPTSQDYFLFILRDGRYNYTTRYPVLKGFQSTNSHFLLISGNYDDPSYPASIGTPHWGMDVPAAAGTGVYSPGKGVIVDVGYAPLGCGLYIITLHQDIGSYPYLWFCHLSSTLTSTIGQQVDVGTLIGLSGSTGRSSGAHIHYARCDRKDGSPQVLFPACRNPLTIPWY